ncbi:hypothetical protein GCM10027162_11160 [Streptomyces incanus]
MAARQGGRPDLESDPDLESEAAFRVYEQERGRTETDRQGDRTAIEGRTGPLAVIDARGRVTERRDRAALSRPAATAPAPCTSAPPVVLQLRSARTAAMTS